MKLNHIGYAVNEIDASFKYFKLLGFTLTEDAKDDNLRKIRVCAIKNNGTQIKLMEYMNEKTPIGNVISKNGTTPYHLFGNVDNILKTVSDLQKNGFMLLSPPKKDLALDGKHIALLFKKEIGIVELVSE